MYLSIHLYFNISRLLYGFLSKRKRNFLVLEFVFIVSILIIVFLLDSIFSSFIKHFIYTDQACQFIKSLFYGFYFLLTSLISRIIYKENPKEAVDIGSKKHINSVGIIDFSWISILAVVYSGVLFVSNLDSIRSEIKVNKSVEYYNLYYDEAKYLISQTITIILALGTILAGCMAIIWSGGIWRKRDPKTRPQYLSTTLASIKMVAVYFVIVIAIIYWVVVPLYLKLSLMKEFIY